MALPFISIIVVNYNLKTFLKELMEGLLQTEYPSFEILFVDNASKDQSVEYVRGNFQDKRLRIIALEDNLGLYRAQNLAAKRAEGEYLCFLDADVKVGHNWLLPMVEVMIKDKSVGAIQPFVIRMENSLAHLEKSTGDKDIAEIQEIPFPRGVCTLVKKEVFERLLGFDEDFFYRYGDKDFGWRIWLYGYRCVLVSAAEIHHAGRRKAGERVKRARQARMRPFLYHDLKNHIVMQLKFGEAETLLRLMPLYLLCDLLILAANVRDRSVDHWRATIRAVLWVIKNMRSTMRKRSLLQRDRRIGDAALKARFPGELFIYDWCPWNIIGDW